MSCLEVLFKKIQHILSAYGPKSQLGSRESRLANSSFVSLLRLSGYAGRRKVTSMVAIESDDAHRLQNCVNHVRHSNGASRTSFFFKLPA